VPQLQSIDAEEAAIDEPRNEEATPEEQWASTEAVQIAGDRLAELGDKYGQIFNMRFVEGYSESEIARKLSLNVATVKTRAYRARAHLKRELEEALAA
jgi:RNA polymerase sigma factor (sigma-70 family)